MAQKLSSADVVAQRTGRLLSVGDGEPVLLLYLRHATTAKLSRSKTTGADLTWGRAQVAIARPGFPALRWRATWERDECVASGLSYIKPWGECSVSPTADSKQTGQEALADELSQILPRFLEAAREEDQGDG